MKPPVALFVFNRAKNLDRTLECLKNNKIPELYVFADGPRNKNDLSGIEEVRKKIDQIKWTKVIKTYQKKNLGLSESIQYGLNTVFKKHDSAIVIEDDVCVSPGFYDYMVRTLDLYKKDERIAGITGLKYPFPNTNLRKYKNDVFLTPRFSSWGWGTWKTVWDKIIFDKNKLKKDLESKKVEITTGGVDLSESSEKALSGELTGCWDVFFYINMALNGQYFVWPKYNLVENSGLFEGTHTGSGQVGEEWLSWEKNYNSKWVLPARLSPNDRIISDFLTFFEPRKEMNIKQAVKKLVKKVLKPEQVEQKPDPAEYSTVGSQEVPCQKESYFLALNKYVKDGDRVLDVGMGIGYGMNILSIKAKEVYAVDVDKAAVENCSKTVLGKNPKVKELKHYDGYHLPYKDNFFDVVTCVDVVEHVEDYNRFIDELLRVSKRAVVFATPNRRPEYTNPDGTPKNHWHLREWSFEEFDKIIRNHAKKIDWNVLDGPWDGPFQTKAKASEDTLVLLPALIKK